MNICVQSTVLLRAQQTKHIPIEIKQVDRYRKYYYQNYKDIMFFSLKLPHWMLTALLKEALCSSGYVYYVLCYIQVATHALQNCFRAK